MQTASSDRNRALQQAGNLQTILVSSPQVGSSKRTENRRVETKRAEPRQIRLSKDPQGDAQTAEHTFEVEVAVPLSVPEGFVDYASEGEEPADLALIELIPSELAAFNLNSQNAMPITIAHKPSATDQALQKASDLSSSDLSDLTPDTLVSLNLQPKKAVSNHQQPLPNLSTLSRVKPTKKTAEPTKTSSNRTAKHSTVQVPVGHLNRLNNIIEELLQQQTKQTQHNEQLGALVKQLLRQLAQQQIRCNGSEKDAYSNIQQLVTDCLSGTAQTEPGL